MHKACIVKFTNFVATLMALLLSCLAFGQTNLPNSTRKKLTAADFKGVPDESMDYLAKTNTVVSLKYYKGANCSDNRKIKLIVETKISVRESSWMKLYKINNQRLMDALLSHEQGHYDLEEIFSIDLHRTLSAMCFDSNRYRLQVDSTYRLMHSRYNALQQSYDEETGYMHNIDIQFKWKQRIAAMLKNAQ